eukprot:jgi/Mesen1/3980/ME000210S03219
MLKAGNYGYLCIMLWMLTASLQGGSAREWKSFHSLQQDPTEPVERRHLASVSGCESACPRTAYEYLGPASTPQKCVCVNPLEVKLQLLNATGFISNDRQFWSEFAAQLSLDPAQVAVRGVAGIGKDSSSINVTVWLLPAAGARFSAAQYATISRLLNSHTVKFDPNLFGPYRVIRIVQLAPPPPPPPSPPPPRPPPAAPPPPQPPAPPGQGGSSKKSSSSMGLVIGIAAGTAILLAVAGCVVWTLMARRTRRCKAGDLAQGGGEKDVKSGSVGGAGAGAGAAGPAAGKEESSSLPRPMSTRVFTFEELHDATCGFDSSMLLGEGGFGRVYRGKLKDGTQVAIKKLTSGGQQGDKEFLVEVEMLSRLHHRHLVKLIGYYASADTQHQLLCYELVPNGSLESWLHGHMPDDGRLDWDTRMRIAIGAARGLAYLHEDSQPCVIHRDFKASNILLERSFNAKVADFGLAKQAPEGAGGHVSTRVMGTFGYVAPEYAMTGHLLVKSDVYSYGVVLLELLSGRKPVDMTQPAGQENLVTWARPLLRRRERHQGLVDPLLQGHYPEDDLAHVAAIAAACVAPEAQQRPTMGEVVQSLKIVQRESEYTNSGEQELFGTAPAPLAGAPSSKSGKSETWPERFRAQAAKYDNLDSPTSGSSFVSSESGPLFKSRLPSNLTQEELERSRLESEDLAEGR